MSSFTTPLELDYIDGSHWRLTSAFDYHVGEESSREVIEVPKGFITDFASVPRILWNILPPTGPYGKAAVIHDYLYVMGGIPLPKSRLSYNKPKSDKIFLEAMEVLGVGRFKRNTMYLAVKLFGVGNFNKNAA